MSIKNINLAIAMATFFKEKDRLKTMHSRFTTAPVSVIFIAIMTSSTNVFAAGHGIAAATGAVTLGFQFSPEDVAFGEKMGYDIITLKDGKVNQNVLGVPEVPFIYKNVLIPADAEVTDIQVKSEEMMLLAEDINLVPVQQPRQVSAKKLPEWVAPRPDIYTSQERFPLKAAYLVSGTQKLRGWRFVEVKLCPLYYIPAAGDLFLSTEITVEVIYEIGEKTKVHEGKHGKLFEDRVKKLVVNPDLPDAAPMMSTRGNIGGISSSSEALTPLPFAPKGKGSIDYIIITPSSFSSAFQALADHRMSYNGWNTEIITIETISSDYSGSDIQGKIRNCIID